MEFTTKLHKFEIVIKIRSDNTFNGFLCCKMKAVCSWGVLKQKKKRKSHREASTCQSEMEKEGMNNGSQEMVTLQ